MEKKGKIEHFEFVGNEFEVSANKDTQQTLFALMETNVDGKPVKEYVKDEASFKEIILKDMCKYNSIPFHIGILLFILKTLHYTFP
ncbi:MAG: hypothetical protein KGD67_13050, partial [Candidatus Lokiarchaeota archaeon]|nr:hypothetical protein [Candidatus Lokiarchaeota archaeon]